MTSSYENAKWNGVIQPFRFPGDNEEPIFSAEDIEQINVSEIKLAHEYKESIIWSFDVSLAIFLDQGLTGIMGHKYTFHPEGIKEARNVFRAYHQNDDIFVDAEEDDFKALHWAFDWVKENFTSLWT